MHRPKPDTPGPGQESVWDYPRPPRIEQSDEKVVIELGGREIARTSECLRVLETSHPPTYYLPRAAFERGVLRPSEGESWCEWKGRATWFDLHGGRRVARGAAWSYQRPTAGFRAIAGYVAVMPGVVDRCLVDGEVVQPQPGEFYGGWITSRVVGPFKGGPGTMHW
jgi:uncharacterized protein (DUF427 family)